LTECVGEDVLDARIVQKKWLTVIRGRQLISAETEMLHRRRRLIAEGGDISSDEFGRLRLFRRSPFQILAVAARAPVAAAGSAVRREYPGAPAASAACGLTFPN